MKYSALFFAAVIAVTVSHTPAVSKAIDDNNIIGEVFSHEGFSDLKLSVNSDGQSIQESENKSPRKPKKFKKKSHAYNKKRSKRK
jgi:hypothetical protein